jgi:hypothetical protein
LAALAPSPLINPESRPLGALFRSTRAVSERKVTNTRPVPTRELNVPLVGRAASLRPANCNAASSTPASTSASVWIRSVLPATVIAVLVT